MFSKSQNFRLATLALMGVLAASSALRAGMIPTQVSVLPDGDKWRWTYAVVVTTDVQVNPGDSFTIYDFAGLVGGSSVVPVGWSVSTSGVTTPPMGTNPVDDPGLMNLNFTYNGESPIVGQQGLGNFWALSDYSDVGSGDFTSTSHRQVDGRVENNITATDVPVGNDPPPPNDTPEPTSLAIFGLGLPLVGAYRLWRMKRNAK
jgi:hypothetical protein